MYAVIRTGGKQYRVAARQRLRVEKLKGEPGEIVVFEDVLMLAGNGEAEVGAPLVAGASVAAEIVEQTRGPKIVVFKKRRRKNYRRTRGHRQDLTLVEITEVLTGGAKPKPRAAKQAEEPKAKPKAAKPKTAKPKAAKPEAKARTPAAEADKGAAAEGPDVTALTGVGPKLKEKLAAAGIDSVAQIAALSPEEAERLDGELGLKGKMDKWVEEARGLLAETGKD